MTSNLHLYFSKTGDPIRMLISTQLIIKLLSGPRIKLFDRLNKSLSPHISNIVELLANDIYIEVPDLDLKKKVFHPPKAYALRESPRHNEEIVLSPEPLPEVPEENTFAEIPASPQNRRNEEIQLPSELFPGAAPEESTLAEIVAISHESGSEETVQLPIFEPRKTGGKWNVELTLSLLSSFQRYKKHFDKATWGTKSKIWDFIATCLSKKSGTIVSGIECYTKWKTMKQHYTQVKTRKKPIGAAGSRWRFYHCMDEILKMEQPKAKQPEMVKSENSPPELGPDIVPPLSNEHERNDDVQWNDVRELLIKTNKTAKDVHDIRNNSIQTLEAKSVMQKELILHQKEMQRSYTENLKSVLSFEAEMLQFQRIKMEADLELQRRQLDLEEKKYELEKTKLMKEYELCNISTKDPA